MTNYALITGASNGIGLELAKLFAADGVNLILVARNREKLEEIATEFTQKYKIQVLIISADLSDPSTPDKIFTEVQSKNLIVEYLVNNAGFGTNGKFTDLPLKGELDEIQVNLTSLVHLTRLFLPAMTSGKILNVASTASFQPGPFMATYYASKAFVLSFSQALAEEMKNTGVTVTALCPGPTVTGFDKRAGVTDLPLFKTGNMLPDEVAKIGYKALMNGQMTVVTGLKNKFGAVAAQLLPKKTILSIVRRMQEK